MDPLRLGSKRASGDFMLDANGNFILDDAGRFLLDDGAGNACCCNFCPIYAGYHSQCGGSYPTPNTYTSATATLSSWTPNSCFSQGGSYRAKFVSGFDPSGTWDCVRNAFYPTPLGGPYPTPSGALTGNWGRVISQANSLERYDPFDSVCAFLQSTYLGLYLNLRHDTGAPFVTQLELWAGSSTNPVPADYVWDPPTLNWSERLGIAIPPAGFCNADFTVTISGAFGSVDVDWVWNRP